MNSLKICFIRHGRTEYNGIGAFSGRTDAPVTEEGIELLKKLKEECVYPDVGRVYTSPAKRTRMTAEILFPDVPKQELYDLWEFDFGDRENTVLSDYDEAFLKRWYAVEPGIDFCRNSETYMEAALRGELAVSRIIRDCIYDGLEQVAVVAHGAIMRALFKYTLEPSQAAADRRRMVNGCGILVETDPELWFNSMKMRFISDVPFKKED